MSVGSSEDLVHPVPVTTTNKHSKQDFNFTLNLTSNVKENGSQSLSVGCSPGVQPPPAEDDGSGHDSDDLAVIPPHHAPSKSNSRLIRRGKQTADVRGPLGTYKQDDDLKKLRQRTEEDVHKKVWQLGQDVRQLRNDIQRIDYSFAAVDQLQADLRQLEYSLAVVERNAATERITTVVIWDLFPTLNFGHGAVSRAKNFFAAAFDVVFLSKIGFHHAVSRAKIFCAAAFDVIFLARILLHVAKETLTRTIRTFYVKYVALHFQGMPSPSFNMMRTLCIILVLVTFLGAYKGVTLRCFTFARERNGALSTALKPTSLIPDLDQPMGFSWGRQKSKK